MENLPESTLKAINKLSNVYAQKFHRLEANDLYVIGVTYYVEKYKEYDASKSNVNTHAYITVRNHFNNLLRRQYRQKRYSGNYVTYEEVDHKVSYNDDDKVSIYGMSYDEAMEILEYNLPESEYNILEDILADVHWEVIMVKYGFESKNKYYKKKGLIMMKCRNILNGGN